ncbi:transcriptional regulator [Pseudomonas jilinensis]|uniref:Transcriptional regulator n=2 Tax=Pseudomonas jilinensis TaxID=2078689 RepID=A0A396S209_9PSED|nr:transcriptional regulator [Pseudomonas jilinensis]
MNAVGERLREERERLSLNQEAFGHLGGVNRNTQAKYEKAERNPDSAYLIGLSAAGVDLLYVLTGRRLPPPEESLGTDETELLNSFRKLTLADKAAVLRLTAALAETTGTTNS